MKKKKWLIVLLVPICLFSLFVAIGVANKALLFDNDYYVLIQNNGKKVEGLKTPEGGEVWNREYNLIAYNEEGEGKEVSFLGYKNLRKGAYLKLSVGSGVNRYEEVKENEVPSKAKDKLTRK